MSAALCEAADEARLAWVAALDREEAAYMRLAIVNDDSPAAIEYRAAADAAAAARRVYEDAQIAAAAAAACPSSDHDGVAVPITRRIRAVRPDGTAVDVFRCSYCAEGATVRLLREGATVTLTPIE